METQAFFADLKERGIFLNPQQEQAVSAQGRQTLLLAVPGSGKTTVLVCKIAYLTACLGVDPKRILTMTFSRDAARDMAERYCKLFGSSDENPSFSTIHGFCYRVLYRYAQRYHRQMPKLLADSEGELSKRGILLSLYREISGEFLSFQDDLLDQIENEISLCKNLLLSAEEREDFDSCTEHFVTLFDLYEKEKKRLGVMDFDDMLSFALDILKKCPKVRMEFEERYDYLYVDEAQDTSKVQYEIIRLFSEQMTLFMVGDEDQCIYTFRGAYPEGLTHFSQDYPMGTVLKLEQNYRSGQKIVASANRLIQMNRDRYAKEMFTEQTMEGSLLFPVLEDYSKQGQALLERLAELPPGESVVVLYRNHESAIPVLDLLERKGVPYRIREQKIGFFHGMAVRDILAFFTLAYDPHDLKAFEQIYYKCMCSKKVLAFVQTHVEQYASVFDAAAHTPDVAAFLRERWGEYDRVLRRMKQRSPETALSMIEDKLGYLDYWKRRNEGKNLETISLKLSILKTISKSETNLAAFIERMCFLEERFSHPSVKQDSFVILSSVHASKGLEFDHVILLDCVENLFPTRLAVEEQANDYPQEMEGEVRLFYVAITRAKKSVTIFCANYYNDELVVRSRFVTRLQPPEIRKVLSQEQIPTGKELEDLRDRWLEHKFFGRGHVIDLPGRDMITVFFPKHGKKTFSYTECRKRKLIHILDE